eukprot:CAMPEP_0182591408 /NCGR_PEP_ID=MMETSP1324-20130603/73740_1 /TAXON_ID=236786 /ORGANISM="Florenciella sp., Strain RCC1587" /LENGTH=76 /DNA_ID=CAMNT_0024808709 /DNA_START=20 /DNA_END=247 /DNA_ORIENTATION=+
MAPEFVEVVEEVGEHVQRFRAVVAGHGPAVLVVGTLATVVSVLAGTAERVQIARVDGGVGDVRLLTGGVLQRVVTR